MRIAGQHELEKIFNATVTTMSCYHKFNEIQEIGDVDKTYAIEERE